MEVPGITVETKGAAVLPVARFHSILRESTDEKLQVESDPQGTVVQGDRSKFNLPSADPDEYPDITAFEEEKCIELPARLLKELIHRTLFATDTESSRYALGGVLLEMEGEKIIAVATDGRRLAKMEGPAKAVGGYESGDTMTIVPGRAMQLVERAFTDMDTDVQVSPRDNDVLIKSQRATIYSRLLEGRFPKWRDVLPVRQNSAKIPLTVGPFYAALRQAAIVASEESHGIDLAFGDGSVVFAASTAETGESRVEMPIPYDGAQLAITLDHRFVGDFLKVLDPEMTFTLDVRDAEDAALCTTDDGYRYVVMPLARER